MNKITAFVVAGLLLVLGSSNLAHAANCGSYPYTLTNGQTADANQVMADFNLIRDCGNNSLLGKNNNLSDLQSPATSRTNLGLGTSAVENLANATSAAVVDDGAGNLILSSAPALHSQAFTSNGTFTVPSTALATTVFKFCFGGGGGGGGGGSNASAPGAGGGAGAAGCAWFSGFTGGQSVTINLGSSGSGGSLSGFGGNGGSTTIVANAATLVTATGGTGGAPYVGTTTLISGGAAGSFSASSGGSITLLASVPLSATPGGTPFTFGAGSSNPAMTGAGGNNYFGAGGVGGLLSGSLDITGSAGVRGGGGSGGMRLGTGGAGGTGVGYVEWVQ